MTRRPARPRPPRSRFWPRRRDRRRMLRATVVGGVILLIVIAMILGTMPGT
jgi:uncharacterized iron-regulated membrane protein